MEYKKSPIMTVGKYAGKPVDSLPVSYLRWLIIQDFPKVILDAAMEKIKKSKFSNEYISVSRHAVDMFSLRFMHLWNRTLKENTKEHIGIATFIAKMAQTAWEKGVDVSKHRHEDDGIAKELDGIIFVFAVSSAFPDYRDVITIMKRDE